MANIKKINISIIGAGIFGMTVYIILKKAGYNCQIFEEKNDILLGASTNNLNRVHLGFHYPRDILTIKQSLNGYKSFETMYKKSIIKNFPNYYLISKFSKITFKKYLNICLKNKLKFKSIGLKRLPFLTKNIDGAIRVNEPIYDWSILKDIIKKKISKFKINKIYLKTKVTKILKKENFFNIYCNNKKYKSDYVIDCSYHNSNTLIKKLKKNMKYKYQLTFIKEFEIKNFKRLGIAIMDGNFFSFLPKGKCKNHLLYHVKHSILKQKNDFNFDQSWLDYKKLKKKINYNQNKMFKDLKNYLPNLIFSIKKKNYISPRVLYANVEKTDKRTSEVNEIKKNYFKVFSGKVDHSVYIAKKILNLVNQRKMIENE